MTQCCRYNQDQSPQLSPGQRVNASPQWTAVACHRVRRGHKGKAFYFISTCVYIHLSVDISLSGAVGRKKTLERIGILPSRFHCKRAQFADQHYSLQSGETNTIPTVSQVIKFNLAHLSVPGLQLSAPSQNAEWEGGIGWAAGET